MKADLDPSKGESWVNYPATSIRRLVRNFGIDKGVCLWDGCTGTYMRIWWCMFGVGASKYCMYICMCICMYLYMDVLVGRWVPAEMLTPYCLARPGVEISIGCDIPDASGMSTSSAIICYMFLALARRNNLNEHPRFKENLPTTEELYGYLGFIENGQVCDQYMCVYMYIYMHLLYIYIYMRVPVRVPLYMCIYLYI